MASNFVNGNEEEIVRIERDRKELNEVYSDKPDGGRTFQRNDTIVVEDVDLTDRVDRYNFIHNSKLPPQQTAAKTKKNAIETAREQKWVKMLSEWQKHCVPSKNKYSEKLVGRIFKGIPDAIRNRAWPRLLDVEATMKAQSGVYEKMKHFARQYSPELRQIDLDINRTLRNNTTYRVRYCARQKQLYNILAAYSVYNTEIGYCQGMSTLTALLLMYIAKEEDTFWALSQVMSNLKYSMHGLFKSGFPKLIRFSDKHEIILKTFLPQVHAKFTKCNITPLIYTTKWFLQCYIDALPFSLVLRVWDAYFLRGDIVILAMSYCILKMHKKTLLQKDFDMDKINDFINHKLPENFLYDDDLTMTKLERCIDKLQRHRFDSGPLLDSAPPANELPTEPFGDLTKSSHQELIARVQHYHQHKNEANRDAQLEQLANDRLQVEKRLRAERKQARHEERRRAAAAMGNGGGGDDHLEKYLNNGKPIRNISDTDDSDEEFQNGRGDDTSDDDDDLNPSRISEYEDDKLDKESIISNMTHNSSTTPQHRSSSNVVDHSRQAKSPVATKARIVVDQNTNHSSDYENMPESSNFPNPVKQQQQKQQQQQPTSPQSLKSNTATSLKISTQSSSIIIPTSKSYIIPATASIMSNPPPQLPPQPPVMRNKPVSPPQLRNFNQTPSSHPVASIVTNPAYYGSPYYGSNQFCKESAPSATSLSPNKTAAKSSAEYVRTPHGIYTRTSVLPTQSIPNSPSVVLMSRSQTAAGGSANPHSIPQSSSSVLISNTAGIYTRMNKGSVDLDYSPVAVVSSKRAGSLRAMQNSSAKAATAAQHSIQQFDILNNKINNSSYVQASTKQLLQNHSFRIASIQQQQLQQMHLQQQQQQQSPPADSYANGGLSGSNSYYVISQAPRGGNNNGTSQAAHEQCNGYRNISVNRSGSKKDHAERYDYI